MRTLLILAGAALFALLSACDSSGDSLYIDNDECSEISREPLPASTATLEFTGGSTEQVDVEMAVTPASQGQGLMCRSRVAPGTGMLFVFESPRSSPFWMFNTYIDLDIVYIAEDGSVTDIKRMTSCTRGRDSRNAWTGRCSSESEAYRPSGSYSATLELPAGWLDSSTPGGAALERVTWPPDTGSQLRSSPLPRGDG